MLLGWIFSFEFPIIKNLWTSSFVLYSSGIAIICFAISYWFLDILKYKKLTKPFIAFGTNALIAYFGASIIGDLTSIQFIEINSTFFSIREWMYNDVLTSILNPYNASFAYSIINTTLIFIPIWWLFKKKIIIKV